MAVWEGSGRCFAEQRLKMKSMMIFGAIVGFLTGAGFSLAGECSWPTALWRAGAASLLLAVLARWWGGVWLQSLRDAVNRRRSAGSNPAPKTKPAVKT
jgi:hypothetical protein